MGFQEKHLKSIFKLNTPGLNIKTGLNLLLLFISCNQNPGKSNAKINSNDSLNYSSSKIEDSGNVKQKGINQNSDTIFSEIQGGTDSESLNNKEKRLIELSNEILKCIKANNYNCLAQYIHPVLGIRFSPYGYVDTMTDKTFSKTDLIKAAGSQRIIQWGLDEATEKPIKLSLENYFRKYIYDADFLNAENKSVNKVLGSGNTLNNLKLIYPKANFTEFHFSGFDPKFGGMDWRSLRLVFENYKNSPYLIALIHDEWTI